VPFVPLSPSASPSHANANTYSYKVGDCFVSLPQPQVLELLEASTGTIDEDVEMLKGRLEGVQEEMEGLKKALYGRFGRSINLET
jgi:chaperonin cofactor prefoldin